MKTSLTNRFISLYLPVLAFASLAAIMALLAIVAPEILIAGAFAIMLLAVGTVFLLLLRRDALLLLTIIFLVLPFHTIAYNLVERYFGSGVILFAFAAWKESVILLMLLALFGMRFVVNRQPLPVRWELLFPLFFMAVAVLFVPTAYTLANGIQGYRYLFQGFLILLLLYVMQPRMDRLFLILPWMVGLGSLISIWGFYSRYVMDFYKYLVAFGFVPDWMSQQQVQFNSVFSISGNLFLRANSVFSGPNEFGLYLAILIVVTIALLLLRGPQLKASQRAFYSVALVIMAGGEIISVSRNAWIFVVVATVVLTLYSPGLVRKLRTSITFGSLLVIIVALVPNMRLFLVRTLQLRDSSAAGRAQELVDRLGILLANPLGIGLGRANYKLLSDDPAHVHTEFYLLIIGLELGWLGLAIYLVMMGIFVFRSVQLSFSRDSTQRFVAMVAAALLLGTLSSQLLAAITMEWIFQYYLWFFVGYALFGTTTVAQHPSTRKASVAIKVD